MKVYINNILRNISILKSNYFNNKKKVLITLTY